MKQDRIYQAGLDIGSTTAKLVLIDENGKPVFSGYHRHHARINETVSTLLSKVRENLGNSLLNVMLTGSAGMGLTRRLKLGFTQEVICTHRVIRRRYPDVRTVVDIGGEDSKMIFLSTDRPPDIRMNGSCAGGTGAFIDQLAALLKKKARELNTLARNHSRIYPIASRCGVFAKTDVQNLLSRQVPIEDIAASVFHAVAVQCMNTLARGREIGGKILLCGGVFAFLPELARTFLSAIGMAESDRVVPDRPELIPAMGAAMSATAAGPGQPVESLLKFLEKKRQPAADIRNRLVPLFATPDEQDRWKRQQRQLSIPVKRMPDCRGALCFIGIDSGSTTTKIIVTGEDKAVLFSWYENNNGHPVAAVARGMGAFCREMNQSGKELVVARTTVTGYGEDLIRTAFGVDIGVVETIAHYEAARDIDPQVSFILDIGGQDMKAIFISNGVISRIELNEACSSGCGSFIETFAHSLGFPVDEFARLAGDAGAPCDLGTRCTVFMNSKVKQALKENAEIADISAGLSYSVVKNCLFKVLKLHDTAVLGDHIVVQGGAFKNDSIVRAVELLLERPVACPDMPEMMGALGAALIARNDYLGTPDRVSSFIRLDTSETVGSYRTRQIRCSGCENACTVTRFDFPSGRSFYSGNKCENIFTNQGEKTVKGFDFARFKYDLLFNRELAPHQTPVLTIGIPRCLNFYENFPFWHAFFTRCGMNIVLSGPSTAGLSDKAMGSIMSDNICFPAKLANGHVLDLAGRKVDRIFYPMVMYESREFENAANTFNCPIVSSYTDVIHSSINPLTRFDIPLDRPVVTFGDEDLLRKACQAYLGQFGIARSTIRKAVDFGLDVQKRYRQAVEARGREVIAGAADSGRLLVVLSGRPYHIDPLINHKTPDILTDFGVDVITEDAVPRSGSPAAETLFESSQVITQWAYPNRIYHAAGWVARQSGRIQMIHLNSFGCGPDAVVIDETRSILEAGDKNYTLVKIDEITSPGSVRLRLRSMIESLNRRRPGHILPAENRAGTRRKTTPSFEKKDRERTILAPFFSEDYSGYLQAVFQVAGYRFEILPPPDKLSVDLGLKYASHDICYPGTLVIGDIIKALQSGRYDVNRIAVGITQTGGQCRASNYIALIKKAMISAGFSHIPIISVTHASHLSHQPGFEIDWLKMTKLLFISTMFADCIAKMAYPVAAREKEKGTARRLKMHYIGRACPLIAEKDYDGIFRLLETAVSDFNRVAIDPAPIPRIGIVGEIYIKYNYFGNQYLADWLISHRVEPVIPPILDYFTQDLVNYRENIKAHIRHRKMSDVLGVGMDLFLGRFHRKIDAIMRSFKFYLPFHDIRSVARRAANILSLVNQFGEGWLVPGEIACFAEDGINHVLSVQPFGCIANHIISKGVESRIKSIYPDMNLLFLDFDAGTSEVNVQNRLHFMVESAKEAFYADTERPLVPSGV